jgi:hypothetical protein
MQKDEKFEERVLDQMVAQMGCTRETARKTRATMLARPIRTAEEWAVELRESAAKFQARDLDRGTCTITRCTEAARIDGRCFKHEVGRR